jgi:nucleosome assembly protein 1-like 1
MPPAKVPPPQEVEEEEEEVDEEDGADIEDVPPAEFLKSLEPPQRKCVFALKGLLASYRAARAELRAKIAALEAEFANEVAPLIEKRRQIVAGEHEVTEEETAKGADAKASGVEEIPSDDEKEKAGKRKGVKVITPADVAAKNALEAADASATGGIPEFWLTAMKHHEVVESLITPRDEAALKFLTNVTSERLANSGFALHFHFAENPFFTNTVLTKKFIMEVDEHDDTDDSSLDHSEGTPIEWKNLEQNLTIVLKQKKQRHKSGKGVRIVQRQEPVPSFFRFFAEEPKEDAETEADSAALEFYDPQLEFESGVAMHLSVVPRAAYYYSGKSVEDIATSLQMDGAFGFNGEDEEGEEEEEEEEEEKPAQKKSAHKAGGKSGEKSGAKPGAKPGGKDCKQQ